MRRESGKCFTYCGTIFAAIVGMQEYLTRLLPFLEPTPIPKQTLIQRVREKMDAHDGTVRALVNILYMLRFSEMCRRGNEVVLFD